MDKPVFRFAPSPNGRLHLGHAYSALLNQKMAREVGGKLLLRIEDTDLGRCTEKLEAQMLEDLKWLGLEWDETPLRQSENIEHYQTYIDVLADEGLTYPAFMSRKQIQEIAAIGEEHGKPWPRDPDGALIYPCDDRQMPLEDREKKIEKGDAFAIRLNMKAAVSLLGKSLNWTEEGSLDFLTEKVTVDGNQINADPQAWGDVVLSRKDAPASYHLASVVDDAHQGVTHIVRGRDLFWSTSVHRLLQELLGFQVPEYFHHDLILDEDERKLSKSRSDTSLAELRATGVTPSDIRKMVGLN